MLSLVAAVFALAAPLPRLTTMAETVLGFYLAMLLVSLMFALLRGR
jgi:hypothetical protein